MPPGRAVAQEFRGSQIGGSWTARPVWSIICAKPAGIAIMDLGEWLRGLGLGQYETSFRENGVDAEVLPDLTDAD